MAKPGPSQEELLAQAQARVNHHKDIPTTFFIHFTPTPEGSAATELETIKKDVLMWQSYLSSLAGIKVQEMINSGDLPPKTDIVSQAQRSTYYSQVYAQLLRGVSRPWMTKESNHEEKKAMFSCARSEFHLQLVAKVTEGFSLPKNIGASLDKPLKTICGDIAKASATNPNLKMHYTIVLTRFQLGRGHKAINPIVRVITFETTPDVNAYAGKKDLADHVRLSVKYSQYQSEFNSDVFTYVSTTFPKPFIEGGRKFISKAATLDVSVSV